jgi:hypothetical protein
VFETGIWLYVALGSDIKKDTLIARDLLRYLMLPSLKVPITVNRLPPNSGWIISIDSRRNMYLVRWRKILSGIIPLRFIVRMLQNCVCYAAASSSSAFHWWSNAQHALNERAKILITVNKYSRQSQLRHRSVIMS